MQIPNEWKAYGADEYFDTKYEAGIFDPLAQCYTIAPFSEVYEIKDIEFLAIGRSGADGIDFGYRKGFSGIWVYYPMNHEFRLVAETISEFLENWQNGKLKI